MLNTLSIKNFALIEDVELSLEKGLSIITGETGAGKSILLGALSLLLGKRADLNSIKDPKKKCIIEGDFAIKTYQLEDFFTANELDYDEHTIIRREILPSGKSRAFINDTPVKVKQLSALGEKLVDIHSQHDTLFIGEAVYQYEVIDALAGHMPLLNDYQNSLKTYKSLQADLTALKTRQQEAQKAYDYHSFLLNELRESNLQVGMQAELEERYNQLSNVEELKESIQFSLQRLQQEDFGVNDSLITIKNKISRLENYGQKYKSLSERLTSVAIEVEDITAELENLVSEVEDDPQALDQVNEQLQNLYMLQKKHGVNEVEDLLKIQADLEESVETSEHADADIKRLEKRIQKTEQEADKLATTLRKNRLKVVPNFKAEVESILAKLGMKDAQLQIELPQTNSFTNLGKDHMQWLFSANKGGRFQELKKSASGGELSRITLAIKSILARYSNLPTLIFDEIDTGVSGDVAQKMGIIMQAMGQHLQIISISHLPQIAAKGQQHYKVYKETIKGNTHTTIIQLSPEQRIQEIAEMLDGKNTSASAIAHAKSLLELKQ